MKTKQYELTMTEVLAIRDALTEYWHSTSKRILSQGKSGPLATITHKAVGALKSQFDDDARLWQD